MPPPLPLRRVGYVVSRFPLVTETFVLREFVEVDRRPELAVELFSLFPAGDGPIHEDAWSWLPRLHRGSVGASLRGLGYFLLKRPLRLLRAAGETAWDYRRSPRLLPRALVAFSLAAGHARAARIARLDHVHAHFATYPALTAWLIRRLTGVPYTFTAHAHDIFVQQAGLRRRCDEAAAVIAISDYNRGFLIDHGAAADRVVVVRCGVDPERYSFRPRAADPRRPVRGLCVAGLRDYKGHRHLLEALGRHGSGLESITIDLVGDGPLRRELEALAAELGLGERVTFLGSRSEREVTMLLDNADFFVLPSVVADNGDTEGLPIVLMEALAAGVPTVATSLTGIPELVVDGTTGLLAPPADAKALADALRRLLADPDRARQMAERGREVVEEKFDIRRNVDLLTRQFG